MIAKLIQCLILNFGLQLDCNSLRVSRSDATYVIAYVISAVCGGFAGFGGRSTPALLGGGTRAIVVEVEEQEDRSSVASRRMSHGTRDMLWRRLSELNRDISPTRC